MSTESTDVKWTPIDGRSPGGQRCLNCGTQVTRQFARVFGDNEDLVHGCPECRTYRQMKTSAFIPEEHR